MKKIFTLFFVSLFYLVFANNVFAATIFQDDFTNVDTTTLSTHNSEWTNVSGESLIQSNMLVVNSPPAKYYWNGSYLSQDYKVCNDVTFVQSATNNYYLQYLRTDATFVTWYRYYIQGSGTNSYAISLGKSISSSESTLDSTSVNATDGSVHEVCIGAAGSDLSVTYDGVEILSATDSTITSGYAGIYQGDFPIDNLVITEYSTQSATIKTSPDAGTKTVGTPFSLDVVVDGNGRSFNAVESTVSVSSNFSINSISTSTSTNSCDFQFIEEPTIGDPSFAGSIYGGSSLSCTAYTIILTPNASGSGTITFSDSSISAYDDNSNILDEVQNSTFTINPASPSPSPTYSEFTIDNITPTYATAIDLYGNRNVSIVKMFIDGFDTNTVYPTGTTWEYPVSLVLGANTFEVYGENASEVATDTQSITINRHTLGDINGDGLINLIDASLFAVDWGKTENLTYNLSDMNDDLVVNLTDLSILAKLQ